MSSLGIFESSSDLVIKMIEDLGFDKNKRSCIIMKIINVAARCSYYRNKPWTNPELLEF